MITLEEVKEFGDDNLGKIVLLTGAVTVTGIALAFVFPPAGILYGIAVGGCALGVLLTGMAGGRWLTRKQDENKDAEKVEVDKNNDEEKDAGVSAVMRELLMIREEIKGSGLKSDLVVGQLCQLETKVVNNFDLLQQDNADLAEEQKRIHSENKLINEDIRNALDKQSVTNNPFTLYYPSKIPPDFFPQTPDVNANITKK